MINLLNNENILDYMEELRDIWNKAIDLVDTKGYSPRIFERHDSKVCQSIHIGPTQVEHCYRTRKNGQILTATKYLDTDKFISWLETHPDNPVTREVYSRLNDYTSNGVHFPENEPKYIYEFL